ncbi:MAG: response regulator [Elainellaceae cyanobacterium]
MRLLLVDDDEALMEILAENLIRQRYAVDIAVDGETAQEFLALFPYDLIVLDWLLPDAEGIALCRQLRQQGITAPILMLSVRDDSGDKVQALDAGADDYVVKPVDFEELRARIRALLRRDSHGATAELTWGNLSLNPSSFEVFYGGHQLHTTPKEYALLELFLRHPTQVFSLDAIIESIWSFEDPPSGDAVRTHIKGVRQKLKAGGAPKNFIETVYGLGYRLKALDATDLPQEDDSGLEPQQQTQSEMTVALAKAWEAHEETMRERLDVLEATSAAMVAGQLSADLQQAGRSHAHKLAGSLGCFGFSEGSLIARELERLLQLDVPLNDQHGPQVSELVARLRRNLANGSSHDILSAAIASVPQLWIVGAQASFSQRFVDDAIALGIRSQVVFDPDEVKAMLQTHPPIGVGLIL